MLRITDIQDNRVEWDTVPRCECSEPAKYALKAGDIVIARTGATTGKSFLLREVPESTVFASYLIRVQPNAAVAPEYLANYLLSPNYWDQITVVSKGTAQPGANASILGGLDVPVAPLNEQRRIVAKLEALQARSRRAREALDAVPPLLEKLRQSILAAAFRGDLTKNWRANHKNIEPASELLKRIRTERRKKWEQSEFSKMQAKGKTPTDTKWKAKYKEPAPVDTTGLPELPEGWCWASVEELTLNFDGDRIPLKESDRAKRSGVYPYYGASGVIDDIDAYLFDGRYLLVAEDGANLLSRSTDIAFEVHGRFWVNNHAHVVQQTVLAAGHLCHYLNGLRLEPWVSGTAQPKLTQKNFNRIPVPACSEDESLALVERIQVQLQTASGVQQRIQTIARALASLEQATLAKAFRGELVPQDPNDEPAEVTLKAQAGLQSTKGAPKKGPRARAQATRGTVE
jgi:type I restriction enzyme, S subunit